MTSITERKPGNPAYQAYLLLRVGFTAAPILFGLDKFFNWMVDWPDYLAPWMNDLVPGKAFHAAPAISAAPERLRDAA